MVSRRNGIDGTRNCGTAAGAGGGDVQSGPAHHRGDATAVGRRGDRRWLNDVLRVEQPGVVALLLAGGLGLGLGCGSSCESEPAVGSTTAAAGGSAGSGGAEQPPPPDDWCQRFEAGPSGTRTFAVDLSAAHAGVRFFGTNLSHIEVDGALEGALSGTDPWSGESLSVYASALGMACALAANDAPLLPASVDVEGSLAIIHPGTGTVSLPPDVSGVAIDLRGLPAAAELEAALAEATRAALDVELARPALSVRRHRGMTDEFAPVNGYSNIYGDSVVEIEQPAWPGAAAARLPLAVLTGPELAPEAAELAMALRLAARAWLVGEDLLAVVAEARWHGVGAGGLLYRDRMVTSWPDVLPADVRTPSPLDHLPALFDAGDPPAVTVGTVSRAAIEPFPAEPAIEPDSQELATARAALVVAHGAARLFFPYFATVGDTIDQGLGEELDALATSTETGPAFVGNPVRRLSVHLHDSHGIAAYLGSQPLAWLGYVPVLLDSTAEGEIIVRASDLATIQPGDVLLSVGGTPVADVVGRFAELCSGSNPGAALNKTLDYVRLFTTDTIWQLREPAGTVKDVPLDLSDTTWTPPFQLSTRTAGFLGDLGHPSLYYVNLDGAAYDGTPTAEQLITEAQGASGLIVDGRGYPGTMQTWTFIKRLLETATSVEFNTPWVTPLGTEQRASSQPWEPADGAHYAGPVVVLIGPSTLSQAEHILMSLVSTDRAQFVGRQTSGANGNVTGVMVPGSFGMVFTGMEVLFADGSTFHGVGILPDVEVYPTPAALGASLDPELDAAITLLEP
jgi:hypothetical protein